MRWADAQAPAIPGRVGRAGVAVSPYVLHQYLIWRLLDLNRGDDSAAARANRDD